MVFNSFQHLRDARDNVLNLLQGKRGNILAALAGGWFLSMGVRMIYPVMLPHLRTAYELDLTTSGFLLTVLFFAYAIGQLPGGILADQIGERRILMLSLLLSAGTLALVATSTSTTVLFTATALFGFGTALYAVSRYTILPQLYPKQIGTANGVTAASQDAGQSILPPLAGIITTAFFWQLGFMFAIPLFILAFVSLHFTMSSMISEPNDSADTLSFESGRYILSVLNQPAIIYPTSVLILGLSVWQAFTSFYPTYLVEVKGLSTTMAGLLFGLFFALGIFIKPLSGGAYDRIGIRRSLVFIASGPFIALVVLPIADSFWTLIAVTALVSTLLGFATVTEPYLLETLPESIRGTGFGIFRTIVFMIGALSPALFGIAANHGFFDEAFIALAADRKSTL